MMSHKTNVLLTAAMSLFMATAANAQLLTPLRTIKVDPNLWQQLSDEPGHHMAEGYRFFKAGDRVASGASIRKAAIFVQISAANSRQPVRDLLLRTVADLQSLASGIEDGTVIRESELERTFSRAEHALAEYELVFARESWAQKETRLAGNRMRAAGRSLERAAKWSGSELDAGADAAISATRRAGSAMAEGGSFIADEVGRGLDSLGHGISRFGRRFER